MKRRTVSALRLAVGIGLKLDAGGAGAFHGYGTTVPVIKIGAIKRSAAPLCGWDTAPAKTSHEIAFSARLSGTSFKSALPGR